MPFLQPLICKQCGGILKVEEKGGIRCEHCAAVYASPHSCCPRCDFINEKDAVFCEKCGMELMINCRICGTPNWSGGEHCINCGRDLDALEHAFRSFNQSHQLHQEESRAEIPALRRREEEDSRGRLELLDEIDRRRWLAETVRNVNAKRRERIIIIGMSIAVVVFLFMVLGILILGA